MSWNNIMPAYLLVDHFIGTFTYSDGTTKEKGFYNKKAAQLFAHNEGDHLLKWELRECT